MSLCREEGKDTIIFVTNEELNTPSAALITLDDRDDEPGLILPDGTINWQCPCLGGLPTGPCGVEVRQAFSCFYSERNNPEGPDCGKQFVAMNECMGKYSQLYPSKEKTETKKLEQAETENLEQTDQQSGIYSNERSDKKL